jgi:hypothetical protein
MENTLTRDSDALRGSWVRIGLVGVAVFLAALAMWMIGSQVAGGLSQQRQATAQAAFEDQAGIRILRVVMTAGGGMVDIQYQVLDPDKSLIVHTAVTYHEIIMNGGGLLRRGSKVTLTVGDSRLAHVVVQ